MVISQDTLQDLTKCTVAIQKAGSDSVLGTGVIVTDDGLIVTCYHVVGNIKTKTLDKTVDVYFPSAHEIKGQANVLEEYCNLELDIAFLQLQEKELPEKVAVANLSESIENGHEFKSFGCRKYRTFDGLNSFGRIDGKTRKKLTENNNLSPNLIQLYSDAIDHGMSGATVLDTSINRVIGIVSEYFATSTNIDRNLALAIPVESIIQVYPELKQKNPGLRILEFLRKIGAEGIMKYERIDELYVQPVEYDDIKKALNEDRIVFITGTEGYGKTYTAVRLLWEYFNKGYEPKWVKGDQEDERSEVRNKLVSIERVLKPGQIIYFEDPFGKTKFEGNDEILERNIANIIDFIQSIDNAYVIITSRDRVFKEFKSYANIDLQGFEKILDIRTPSYDYETRKEILYRLAKVKNCEWLDDDILKDTVMKVLTDERNLPTPLSIEEFVIVTKNKLQKNELLYKIQTISKETAKNLVEEIENISKKRLQDLSKCTVAIQTSIGDKILGSGVIVTDDGLILTCYHVIGYIYNKNIIYRDVHIYFPSAPEINGHANVIDRFCDPKLDIAFLQLEARLPKETSVADLSDTIDYTQVFQSFGFRKPNEFSGLKTTGEIRGIVERRSKENRQLQKVIQLYSNEIGPGMSGAPVLDKEINRVIGIISEHYRSQSDVDNNLSFAVPIGSIVKVCPVLEEKNPGLNIFEFLRKNVLER